MLFQEYLYTAEKRSGLPQKVSHHSSTEVWNFLCWAMYFTAVNKLKVEKNRIYGRGETTFVPLMTILKCKAYTKCTLYTD